MYSVFVFTSNPSTYSVMFDSSGKYLSELQIRNSLTDGRDVFSSFDGDPSDSTQEEGNRFPVIYLSTLDFLFGITDFTTLAGLVSNDSPVLNYFSEDLVWHSVKDR